MSKKKKLEELRDIQNKIYTIRKNPALSNFDKYLEYLALEEELKKLNEGEHKNSINFLPGIFLN